MTDEVNTIEKINDLVEELNFSGEQLLTAQMIYLAYNTAAQVNLSAIQNNPSSPRLKEMKENQKSLRASLKEAKIDFDVALDIYYNTIAQLERAKEEALSASIQEIEK